MRFTEIPHFIIKEFIKRAHEEDDVSFVSEEYGTEFDGSYSFSYLKGPKTTIVTTQEGQLLEVYAKTDTGFSPLQIRVSDNFENENKFFFDHIPDLNQPSDLKEIVQETHYYPDNDPYLSYKFEVYNLQQHEDIDLTLGLELYMRKDSVLNNWLREYASEIFENKYDLNFIIQNFVNVNKPYVYLGDLYFYENQYYFLFYNLKHFVQDSIPQHQRTGRLKAFLYLAFDILYNEVYQMQKDTWNMLDPEECNEEVLSYIATYHGMNFYTLDFEIYKKRWLIDNLTHLLKMRGTYSALLFIFKYITFSRNRLNIYERWHDVAITGSVSDSDYTDWLHTSFYDEADFTSGVGESWYEEYFSDSNYPDNFDNMRLSTQYIVEPDLTTEPLESEDILTKSTIDALYDLWEIFRPVHRTTDYKMLISPISDFSGTDVSLYSREFIPYFETTSQITLGEDAGAVDNAYLEYVTESHKIIYHGLYSKDLLVDLYDSNLVRIPRNKINYVQIYDDNRIVIDLTETIFTFVLIKSVPYSELREPENTVKHSENTKSIITQFFDSDNHSVEPTDVQLFQNDLIYIFTDEVDSFAVNPAQSKINVSNQSIWNISHYLDYSGLLIDVYDENDYQITPDKLKIVDKDNIRLEFGESVSGYVLIYPVGSVGEFANNGCYISQNSSSDFTINHGLDKDTALVQVYDDQLEKIKAEDIEIIDNNNIYINIGESVNTYTFIRGVDLPEYDWISKTLIHNYRDIVSQWYYEDELTSPDYMQIPDTQTIVASGGDFDKLVFEINDFKDEITQESTTWTINHGLDALGIIVNTYNSNWERIYPGGDITINNSNQCTISFDTAQKGYVLISKIGNPSFDFITDRVTDSKLVLSSQQLGYEERLPSPSGTWYVEHNLETTDISIFTFDENWNSIDPNNIDILNNNEIEITFSGSYEGFVLVYEGSDVTVNIIDQNRIREEGNYYYLEYKLPKSLEMDIREMSIQDSFGQLLYTICSTLHKPDKFEMNVFYRVSKSQL